MVVRIIQIVILPVILYTVFVVLRVEGIQPPAESELGEFITAVNFIFGGSVAYFIYINITMGIIKKQRLADQLYWFIISIILFFVAFDEIYMIHETLYHIFRIPEIITLGIYGLLIFTPFLLNRACLSMAAIILIALFALCGIVAVGVDTVFNEGTIRIFSYDISYEQQLESFAALFLTSSVIAQASRLIEQRSDQAE